MSFLDHIFGRTPEKLKARALAHAEKEQWMDARIVCNDALERLPQGAPERGELAMVLEKANEAIARRHLDAADAYLEADEKEKAVERAALARDLAVSGQSKDRASKILRGLADDRSWSKAPQEHMIERDSDLAQDSGTDQEIEALFDAQGERAESYRAHGIEMGRALQAAADNDLPEAKKLLLALQKSKRKDPLIAFELGHVLHALGDSSGAARNLRKAVEGDPGRSQAVLELADVSLSLGHRKGAVDALRRFSGEDPQVTQRLGEILIATGKLDEAHQMLEAAVGTDKESAAVYRLLGEIAERQEDYKTAGRLYDRAFAKGPSDPMNALWLARFLSGPGDDALRAIETYNALADRDAAGRFLYFRKVGELYLKLGHTDEAIDILENAKGLTPPSRAEDRKEVEALLDKAYDAAD